MGGAIPVPSINPREVEPVEGLGRIAAPVCIVTGALIALTAAIGRVMITAVSSPPLSPEKRLDAWRGSYVEGSAFI